MTKVITKYVCQSCGYMSPRWTGKCPNCNEWNTFVEEAPTPAKIARKSGGVASKIEPVALNDVNGFEDVRFKTGIAEFDRVLGGGLVSGSVVLLGGDPGIGKSTLMMQVALKLRDKVILYVTGEESLKQIKLRAERLGTQSNSVLLLPETNLEMIADVIERGQPGYRDRRFDPNNVPSRFRKPTRKRWAGARSDRIAHSHCQVEKHPA